MSKKTLLFAFLLSSTITVRAKAATYPPVMAPIAGYVKTSDNITMAQGLLDEVIVEHNGRFNAAGVFTATEIQNRRFIDIQNENVGALKAKGSYKFLFSITNNMSSSATQGANFVISENNELLAVSFEGAPSNNVAEQSILRLRPVDYLNQPQAIQEIEGQTALVMFSNVTDWSAGGEIQLHVLTDKKKKKYASIKVRAAQNEKKEWALFYGNLAIKKMQLKLWVNVFAGNGGISEVTVNDSVKMLLEPIK
ncbi:MAG: hypothetical protein V4736_05365 [Bdellovibrionota bacterium]